MTDRLKDFIDNNLDGFNDLEPPKTSWDQISARMGHPQNARRRIVKYISYATAASIAGILIFIITFNNSQQEVQHFAENPEIAEAEAYYTTQVNQKKEQVYQLAGSFPELKQEMENDLAELDTIMLELKNDLKDNVSNTEVVEAMIQNYRMKLMILEDIKTFLEQKNEDSQNTISYEL